MNERLKYEGRLAEYRHEAERLKLKIKGLRDSIRDALDPFEAVEDLKADVASQQAMELWSVQQRYLEILEEIRRIEKYLGKSA